MEDCKSGNCERPSKTSDADISNTLASKTAHTTINVPSTGGITEEMLDRLKKGGTMDLEAKEVKSYPIPNENKPAKPDHPIPLQDFILITKTKPEEKIGSIYIPETAIKDSKTGIIVAIGPKVGRENPQTMIRTGDGLPTFPKPGDLVEYGEYAGLKIEYKGKKYLIMREADILCILP